MKEIIILSPSSPKAVRTEKLSTYLHNRGYSITFKGWNRTYKTAEIGYNQYNKIKYICKGGGERTKILPMMYCYFISKLILTLLSQKTKGKVFLAINFETAFSCWLVSHFKKINYIYDIWDELAISHNFPDWLVKIIRGYDKKIRKRAAFYIHVDENRISEIDCNNYIILYNSPVDFIKNSETQDYENSFAVTGWLNSTRGLQSIYEFAKANPNIKFIVAGKFLQEDYKKKYLALKNIEHHDFMPQKDLFSIIKNCRGIFSIYDPTIPINRLAASNKLYDAMMLSIPVIINKDLVAAKFVKNNNLGYIVDYKFGSSWDCLKELNLEEVKKIGSNGRKKYLEEYEFNSLLDRVLFPRIEKLFK